MLNTGSSQTLKFLLTNCQTAETVNDQNFDWQLGDKAHVFSRPGKIELVCFFFATSSTGLANILFYDEKKAVVCSETLN